MIIRIIFLWVVLMAEVLAVEVLVSIKPLHSVVSGLMSGVGAPKLLLNSSRSAHHFHLKPSQFEALNQADLIISVHPDFEQGIKKLLAKIDNKKKLFLVPIIDEKEDHHHQKDHHHSENEDYHTWLSVEKMLDFAKQVAAKLRIIDSKNEAIYTANLNIMTSQFIELKTTINKTLQVWQNAPIALYSKTFSHFINENNLQAKVIVSDFHGQRLSINRTLSAKRKIHKHQVRCLLSSIEVATQKLQILTRGSAAKIAQLDIIGANIPTGSGHYPKLMLDIAGKVERCLR